MDKDSATYLVVEKKVFEVIYYLALPIEKNIDTLPPSFFHFLANLCLTELSINLMVSQGFLKLTIENLKRLHRLWVRNDETGSLLIDIATNLLIISRCANYHKPSIGSANDVIFNPTSNVVEFCIDIIRISEYSTQNPHYIQAIYALSKLSEDKARCVTALYESDILKLLHSDLLKCRAMSAEIVERYVKLVYNLAAGLRIQSLAFQLLTLREPLFLVARVHPSLLDSVKDTVWAITENNLSSESREKISNEETIHSYLSAKEALELWELGIDVREKIRPLGEVISGSGDVAKIPDVVDNTIGSASPSIQEETQQVKRNAKMNLHNGLSFIARDSKIRLPENLKMRTKRKGNITPKRSINPEKMVTMDVHELPELRLTRPLLSLKCSTTVKEI